MRLRGNPYLCNPTFLFLYNTQKKTYFDGYKNRNIRIPSYDFLHVTIISLLGYFLHALVTLHVIFHNSFNKLLHKRLSYKLCHFVWAPFLLRTLFADEDSSQLLTTLRRSQPSHQLPVLTRKKNKRNTTQHKNYNFTKKKHPPINPHKMSGTDVRPSCPPNHGCKNLPLFYHSQPQYPLVLHLLYLTIIAVTFIELSQHFFTSFFFF